MPSGIEDGAGFAAGDVYRFASAPVEAEPTYRPSPRMERPCSFECSTGEEIKDKKRPTSIWHGG